MDLLTRLFNFASLFPHFHRGFFNVCYRQAFSTAPISHPRSHTTRLSASSQSLTQFSPQRTHASISPYRASPVSSERLQHPLIDCSPPRKTRYHASIFDCLLRLAIRIGLYVVQLGQVSGHEKLCRFSIGTTSSGNISR